MAIRFNCPFCKKPIKAAEKGAGATVSCPSCKRPIEIPSQPPVNPEVPANADSTGDSKSSQKKPRSQNASSRTEKTSSAAAKSGPPRKLTLLSIVLGIATILVLPVLCCLPLVLLVPHSAPPAKPNDEKAEHLQAALDSKPKMLPSAPPEEPGKKQVTLVYWNRMLEVANQNNEDTLKAASALVLGNRDPFVHLLRRRISDLENISVEGVDDDAVRCWGLRVNYLKANLSLYENLSHAALIDHVATIPPRPDPIDREQEEIRLLLARRYLVAFTPTHPDAVVEGEVTRELALQIAPSLGYVCLRDVKMDDRTGVHRHLMQIGCVFASTPQNVLTVLPALHARVEEPKTIIKARLISKSLSVEPNRLLCKFRDSKNDILDIALAKHPSIRKGGGAEITVECLGDKKPFNMEIVPAPSGELHGSVRHSGAVEAIVVSDDGRFCLSADDKTLQLWELRTGRELKRIVHGLKRIQRIAFSGDKRFAVVGGGGSALSAGSPKGSVNLDDPICVLDLQTGKEVRRFQGHATPVSALAITADGRFVLSGHGVVPFDPRQKKLVPRDCVVRVWGIATGKEVARYAGHSGIPQSIILSKDGRSIWTTDDTGTTKGWDLTTQTERGHIPPEAGRGFGQSAIAMACPTATGAFSVVDVSGTRFAVRQWDPRTQKTTPLAQGQAAKRIEKFAYSGNGRRIAMISNDWFAGFASHFLSVHDITLGHAVYSEEHGRGTSSMATVVVLSEDGRWVAVGSQDGRVRVFLLPER